MTHEPPAPVGLYEPYALAGPLVFISAISSSADGELIVGKVGDNIDLATASAAAERAAKNLLAVLLQAAGGDSSRIGRVLMVRGYVNAAAEFRLVHRIVDAASNVIIAELGEKGRHARTAIGCSTLPNGNVITLDAIATLIGPPNS